MKNVINEIKNDFIEKDMLLTGNRVKYYTNDYYVNFLYRSENSIFFREEEDGYLLELELFTPKYVLKYGITVGMDIDTVIGLLGEPYIKEDNRMIYYSGYPLRLLDDVINPCRLIFNFDLNIVTSIAFDDPGP